MLSITAIELPIDLIALYSHNPTRYPFLLASNHKHQDLTSNKQGRYSFLLTHPGQSIILNRLDEFNFLDKLDDKLNLNCQQNKELPFIGGYFVYLSYELITQLEKKISPVDKHFQHAIAYCVKIDSAIVIDHSNNQSYIVDRSQFNINSKQILLDIDHLNNTANTYNSNPEKQLATNPNKIQATISNTDKQSFISDVQKIKDYIKQGDVFQVNLSRLWNISLLKNSTAGEIYQTLQHHNPAPFSALASYAGFDIISSSPERLFKISNGIIQTRPIAGTYPRSTGDKDIQLQKELLSHPKEQAEHIMLIDLERNDMGRICQYASIKVDELMSIESYPSVHHIVSNIKGELRQNIKFSNIIKSLFPGGTITGCPKIRCMQIITELEQQNRGAYTGAVGYVSHNGNMDFNILIRSLVKQDKQLTLRAGAGIVFDSDAKKEALETEHKAKGVLNIFKAKSKK